MRLNQFIFVGLSNIFQILSTERLLQCLGAADLPSLSDNVNRHSIFTHSLREGAYAFDSNGFIPKEPIEQIRKIHKEMVQTIQKIGDHKKQGQYLLTLSNTAHKDLVLLRQKILDELGSTKVLEFDKTKYKADAFILVTSHAALLGNVIMYFPDIMNSMIKKNPEFGDSISWVINLTTANNFIQDKALLKLFKLVQQELGLVPKESDYVNPYRKRKEAVTPTTTTTKKPRKRLERGPRLSRGEL